MCASSVASQHIEETGKMLPVRTVAEMLLARVRVTPSLENKIERES